MKLGTLRDGGRDGSLVVGDRVRIEMFDGAGHSIFGAIDPKMVPAQM